MYHDTHDIVKAAYGTLVEMSELAEELREAGIECRVVGDDLTAGLGTAIPGSVEVWIKTEDEQRAAKIVKRFDRESHS